MLVLNFKFVELSFFFIHLPIGSDCSISILPLLAGVECLQRKDIYYPSFGLIYTKIDIGLICPIAIQNDLC